MSKLNNFLCGSIIETSWSPVTPNPDSNALYNTLYVWWYFVDPSWSINILENSKPTKSAICKL